MALFEIDADQFQEFKSEVAGLRQAIVDLSENVGKWQGQQTTVIQSGFANLIAAITGADVEAIQQQINALSADLKQSSTTVEDAIKQETEKG